VIDRHKTIRQKKMKSYSERQPTDRHIRTVTGRQIERQIERRIQKQIDA
jgi:hypothetical protein